MKMVGNVFHVEVAGRPRSVEHRQQQHTRESRKFSQARRGKSIQQPQKTAESATVNRCQASTASSQFRR